MHKQTLTSHKGDFQEEDTTCPSEHALFTEHILSFEKRGFLLVSTQKILKNLSSFLSEKIMSSKI